MLRGHVFAEQIFSNECFAHFINTFLNKKDGITKKCNLTYTNNFISIGSGYFVIQGRFLQVVGSNTVEVEENLGYCKLVCEIDLEQINTENLFKQASFKILSDKSNYPVLIQQDLEEGGKIYQFEFAQFQSTVNGITDFKDTRRFIDFESILKFIENFIQELKESSIFLQKTGGTITGKLKVEGGIEGNVKGDLEGNARDSK